ncbi:helix-turn-helix transcriptional regulator [Pseudomonas sp. dw_358]|uniref:helix-turn-helix domain-containing protein n=1 Tax=Pseudomonas sp. dw_358 TaxID=2720083 RepID=UPI002116D6C3|nr:helix-turn-helix transcriptional regulator [Pseudomonas sp. dw_358]
MNENNGENRQALIDDIMTQHFNGQQTLGTAVRRLRLEVTGLDQDTFAAMCKLSTKALYQIEKDKGNPTLSTLDAILRKFGLQMGLARAPKTLYGAARVPQPATANSAARGTNPKRKKAGEGREASA